MKFVKWDKKYVILKEKGRLLRVNEKPAHFMYTMGMQIGFSAGVRRTGKYLTHRLKSINTIDKKTKAILQKDLLGRVEVQHIKNFRDKGTVRLLEVIFGGKIKWPQSHLEGGTGYLLKSKQRKMRESNG